MMGCHGYQTDDRKGSISVSPGITPVSEFTVTFSVSQSLSTLGISIFINTPIEIVGVFIKIIFFTQNV